MSTRYVQRRGCKQAVYVTTLSGHPGDSDHHGNKFTEIRAGSAIIVAVSRLNEPGRERNGDGFYPIAVLSSGRPSRSCALYQIALMNLGDDQPRVTENTEITQSLILCASSGCSGLCGESSRLHSIAYRYHTSRQPEPYVKTRSSSRPVRQSSPRDRLAATGHDEDAHRHDRLRLTS